MDGSAVFEGHEMKSKTIRRWSFIHTWTSLICTVFLLMLALTGLPLIFHHEIDHLLGDAPQVREMSADTPRLNLAQLVLAAEKHRPGEVVQYFGFEDDEPNAVLTIMAKTAGTEPNSSHTFMLDARTGEALETPSANGGVMLFILRLHVDMFAGLPGKLLLAFMGLLFVAAIISGTVLYLPFMRRLKFGTVRQDKSTRLRWLDLHNLIGVVTLAWALTVGVTGVISACADLIIAAWAQRHPDSDGRAVPRCATADATGPGLSPAGHRPGSRTGDEPGFHCLPRHTFFQRAPLLGVHEGRHAPDFASADAGIDRRQHAASHRRGGAPVVHGRHGYVAAAAFW
jgi:uncharacterized iron-regulated membrane protein